MIRSASVVRCAVAVVGAGALVLAGTAPAGAATHHGRARVTFHVTKSGYVHTAATQRPGRARLHAPSSQPVLVVKRKHAGTATLIKDMNRSNPARMIKQFTIVSLVESDTWVTLTRGTYYVVGVAAEHLASAKVATVRVRDKTSNATLPASSTYRVDSHALLHTPTAQPRHRNVHLLNSSAKPEELVFLGLDKSVTDADVQQYLAHPTDENLDALDVVDFEDGGLVGAHRQAWTSVPLEALRYLVFAVPIQENDNGFANGRLVTMH